MHLLATVFIVLRVSVVKSVLSENLSAESAEAEGSAETTVSAVPIVSAAPTFTCEPKSKWGDLTSFIGEEVITKGQETMMNSALYCLNLKTPVAKVPVYEKCYIGVAMTIEKELGNGTPSIPTTKDFKRWIENAMDCFVHELNITSYDTGYDVKYFEKLLPDEDWAESSEDKIAIRTLFTECFVARTGATPVQSYLMNFVECGIEEMGFGNKTTGMYNYYTAGEDFLSNLEGWNSTEVKDSVVGAYKGCEVMQNETDLMKMNEMDRDLSLMKTMLQFNGCFMSKFVDICGLNNDLASMFVPVLNRKLIGLILKDFTDKNGSLALMQIVPAFQEKFQNFFSTMMAMIASSYLV